MPTKTLLASLPYPALMKERLRTFAMLDVILAPDMRHFEFHPKWGKGEVVGAYKDGEGNELFVWFTKDGAVLRGFDHDLPATKDAFKGLPAKLEAASKEPAFGEEVTFVCWAPGKDGDWTAGKSPKKDGSAGLLAPFGRNFVKWATAMYGVEIDGGVLDRIWNGLPLDRIAIAKLNPDYDEKAIKAEARLLGWKVDFSGAAPLPRQKSLPLPKPGTPPGPKAKSFGEAEFVVRVFRDEVKMVIHQSEVVARANVDVYGEIFDWVKARLKKAQRTGV
ncbi:MAG: hypothetical protein U0270_18660 [Labilithrix sp.]